jgi:hypothetical protein
VLWSVLAHPAAFVNDVLAVARRPDRDKDLPIVPLRPPL